MFRINETRLKDCYEIIANKHSDLRGDFTKVFHCNEYKQLGLEKNFCEEYYTMSYRNVIRGMHFQIPPSDHIKIVYCVHGEVLDVMLDLRTQSPTYGKVITIKLSSQSSNIVSIPKGVAHGFLSQSDIAVLVYKVTTVHDPKNDCGVLWNSIPFEWPIQNPIISERDANLKPFQDFTSPFI